MTPLGLKPKKNNKKTEMKKLIKYLGLIFIFYLFSLALCPFTQFLRNRSIENQIEYLSNLLNNSYDDQLQQRFPEGKVFSNAILALSIIEYSKKQNVNEQKWANNVDQCINRLISDEAKLPFNEDLTLEYGVFYRAWINYVFSKFRNSDLFSLSKNRDLVETSIETFRKQVDKIQKDSIQVLESYQNMNWPVDNIVGIATLNNEVLQNQWFQLLKDISKRELIHHSGDDPSQIKGSSQSLITFFLNETKIEEKQEYFDRYNELFVDSYLGVKLVKESLTEESGQDIDSGPVIFGYGASATIMNIKTQAKYSRKAKGTWAFFNVISLPVNICGEKYYLFGKEPMYDLFMLWAAVEL